MCSRPTPQSHPPIHNDRHWRSVSEGDVWAYAAFAGPDHCFSTGQIMVTPAEWMVTVPGVGTFVTANGEPSGKSGHRPFDSCEGKVGSPGGAFQNYGRGAW